MKTLKSTSRPSPASVGEIISNALREPLTLLFHSLYFRHNTYSRIDLGAGTSVLDASFKGVDLFRFSMLFKNVVADVRKGIPLKSNSVSYIYTSHMIEHLTYYESRRLLLECSRVLRTNDGKIRIVCPDLSKYLDLCSKDGGKIFENGAYAISYLTQESGHRSCWNFELLEKLLKECGFKNVSRCSCHISNLNFPVKHEDSSKEWESLYVEATLDG